VIRPRKLSKLPSWFPTHFTVCGNAFQDSKAVGLFTTFPLVVFVTWPFYVDTLVSNITLGVELAFLFSGVV